jgi:hypothetical protein
MEHWYFKNPSTLKGCGFLSTLCRVGQKDGIKKTLKGVLIIYREGGDFLGCCNFT